MPSQTRIAQRRFNEVRQLAHSFLFEIHDAIENLPGSTPARELLVKRALEYLDRLAQEAKGDPSLQQELATAYQKVGDVRGRPAFANLGDMAGALESYRKALAIREALSTADPTNAEVRRDLAASYSKLGQVYALLALNSRVGSDKRIDRWREARSRYQRSLDLWLNMRARSALSSSDAGESDNVAGAIAKCDAALAKLTGSPVATSER